MNIYLLICEDDKRGKYDSFDSMIVYAKNSANAVKIHPQMKNWDSSLNENQWTEPFNQTWARNPSLVSCKKIGSTPIVMEEDVILSSFNAG